jgi:mRNA-degrading endonuclease RelE of RelBE toxin-antitoxin system
MSLTFTFGTGFVDSMIELPKPVYPKLARCLQMLSRNRDYPGLNVEKLHGRSNGLSSARVDISYRLVFQYLPENRIVLLFVGKEEDAYRRAQTAERRSCFRPPVLATVPKNTISPTSDHVTSVQIEPPNRIPVRRSPVEELTLREIEKLLESMQVRGGNLMVETKYADRIREFANERYIEPAREDKRPTVTIRAGDVARALKLQDRIAAVCSALGARAFENRYNVKLMERTGPHTSTTTEFRFRV